MKKGNGRNEFNNEMYRIIDDFFQIQFQAWKELAEIQMDFNQKCINACMQQMTSGRNVNGFFAMDNDTAQEYYKQFTENTRQVMEKLFKVESDLLECLGKSGDLYKTMPAFTTALSAREKPEKQQEARSARA